VREKTGSPGRSIHLSTTGRARPSNDGETSPGGSAAHRWPAPLSDAYRLLLRRRGGQRGYPLLGDIPNRIQAPVLQCVGKVSKCLMDVLLALLTPAFMDIARTKIYKLFGRYNLGAMYLHEFERLCAMVVVVPRTLRDDCDVSSGVVVMLQLIQVLTVSWRRAIGVHPADGRERAAAVLQLSFSLLEPMYAALKPLDPESKKAGVLNLYVYASLSHVRQSVGQALSTLAMVCHDNIEGTIAEMNRNVLSRRLTRRQTRRRQRCSS